MFQSHQEVVKRSAHPPRPSHLWEGWVLRVQGIQPSHFTQGGNLNLRRSLNGPLVPFPEGCWVC